MRSGIPYYFTMKLSKRRYFVQNLGPFQIQRPPIWGEILWPSIGKSKVTSRSIAQESTPIMRYGHSTHDDSQPIIDIGYSTGAIDAINKGSGQVSKIVGAGFRSCRVLGVGEGFRGRSHFNLSTFCGVSQQCLWFKLYVVSLQHQPHASIDCHREQWDIR